MNLRSYSRCITPDEALQRLTEHVFPNQRDVNKVKLAEYIGSMKAGDWTVGSTLTYGVVKQADGSERRYVLNGQHRLTAVFDSGIPIEFHIKEFCFEPDEPAMEEMKKIYVTEDIGAKRTPLHMIQAYDLSAETGITRSYLQRALPAIRMIRAKWESSIANEALSPQQQLRLLTDWQETIRAAHGVTGANNENKLLNAGTLSICFVTMRHCPDRAAPFWTRLRDNDGLLKGSPEHTLHRYISDVRVMVADRYQFVRKVAHAWNAYYEGRKVAYLALKDPKAPVVILGTPYK